MPIHPYGPVQDLSVIQEANAYCWVEIVVNNADAWVFFEGDGPSDLADPCFAAKAGETNRAVILIGKTYRVTCDMPFTVKRHRGLKVIAKKKICVVACGNFGLWMFTEWAGG